MLVYVRVRVRACGYVCVCLVVASLAGLSSVWETA